MARPDVWTSWGHFSNGFSTDVRLLLRQKYGPALIASPQTLVYYKPFEWDPKAAGEKLRSVFEKSWFSEALVPRLKFRPYDKGAGSARD